MTRDPFLRLALIAAAAAFVVALFVVARYLSTAAAVTAAVLGPTVGAGLTLQLERQRDPEDPRRRQRQPREGTAGFERIS